MNALTANTWETAASITLIAVLGSVALWLLLHRRRSEEERERARRQFLARSGRLVDGMLLDVIELEVGAGRTLTLLVYNYRISGVAYECSQDITAMGGVVDPAQVRAGFPCSVRYQPGSPQNSIVIAEEWTGLREGLPVLFYDDRDAVQLGHLRPGRG